MTDHFLPATCQTVHLGGFSAQIPPALMIESGDQVEVETYSGFYVYKQAPPDFLNPQFIKICENLSPERQFSGGPHLLTGPIYIKDAEPGDILEIQLKEITPIFPMGFNAIRQGAGVLATRFSQPSLRFLPLDLEHQTVEFPPESGIKIPLQPFLGIIGVATEEERSSIPPGDYGGNLDNKELQAGSRLFLPVFVQGGLLSIGDGHAVQGDGEVNGTAVETSMKAILGIQLHKGLNLSSPWAETPTHFISMGLASTLDQALEKTLDSLINFLVKFTHLSAEEAYTFCSLAVDFRITQGVNLPQKGVHGLLAKSLVGKLISFPFIEE